MASALPPDAPAVAAPSAGAGAGGWAWAGFGVLLAMGSIASAGWVGARLPVASVAGGTALFYLVVFGPLIALALILGKVTRVPAWRVGDKRAAWSAIGLGCGVGGLLAAVAYAWLNGGLVKAAGAQPVVIGYLALGVVVTAFQVSAEELFFRGWLQPLVGRLGGTWAAVALSALAFSLFHALGGAQAAVSYLNLFLGGVWFALLALRSGGLLAPIAAHFGWNAVEDLALGLVPNPGSGELGTLADYDIVAPAWWGGSPEGLNASVGMTVVLIALILPLLRGPRSA